MFSKSVLSFLALTLVAPALAAPAAPLDIALVKQQFVQALLTPDVVPVFDPVALLNVSFAATGPITTGQAVSMANAGAEPTITVVGTDADFATGGALNSASKYTLIMIDGDYAGAAHPNGVNTHYLQNDFGFGQNTADVLTLTPSTDPVIKYAGPGPAANSGAHRYTILLFAQPTTFTAPATPAAGSSVTMIDFPAYIKAANLGNPLAGIYFTVEVGTATVSPSPTTAVNTATLSVAGGSTASASHSGSASSAGASASSTAKANGAVAKGTSGLAAGVLALMFGAALA
ncbi:hypothetical protein FRC04_000365 [Tulasnella sp. 424]|nr:hypothetical protein FRC04_000365 [Tulasnella sp. 424]KAG8973322.1 hypothetical protein FRC05_008866 [Tulasnella sp. 425]